MAKQAINIGTLANDGTGDTLRAALDKCNDNFDELYALTDGTGAASVLTLAAGSTTLGDTTISDATPILIFKDSSCTDADDNATIVVAATATGTNAENIDVTLTQQVSGVATNWLVSDADGSITLGDATRAIVLSGAVRAGDTTVYDATPVLTLLDSDTADKDAGVSFTASATAVGAGAENVDLTVAQQISGSPVTFLTADADGSITLGDATRAIVLSGAVTSGDATISDATPQLSFRDSSCAVARDNAYILVAATDTGDGTEDADVTLYQHVAGSAVAFLTSDADGSLTVGRSGQAIVLNGAVGDITMKDSTPVLSLIDSDAVDGDAGVSITATCTTATAGAEHVDATFTQQVAGSPVNFLVADADGSITLGDGTRNIALNGKIGDLTLYDTTPVLSLIDSDSADKDAGVSITATCTTATAGAEHVDATFTQQVAGSPVNFLVADADGSITLGDGTRPLVLSGTVGDMTIKDATPVLEFKDSSCAVSDVNAYIEVTATDTGDGTEDADVYIYQQVGGTPFACFYADADGSVALGYNGQPAILNSTTIQGSSPALNFKDTDATAGDVNFDITVAATDVGNGSEDIDVTFSAQVAGNRVGFLNFDADGSLSLGYGGQPVYIAKLQSLVTVTANTGAATPANTNSGTVYTNEGDDNGSSVTLPTAVAGLQFTIYVQVAQTVTVTAGADDTIRIGSSVTAAAGSITSATVGSSVTLVAINAVEWVATASVGSWSFS